MLAYLGGFAQAVEQFRLGQDGLIEMQREVVMEVLVK